MTTILTDRIGSVIFQNGILRVDCMTAGPNNQERLSGTMLVPVNQAGAVLQSLIGAMQELDRRLREQIKQNQAGNSEAAPAGSAEAAPAAVTGTAPNK